MRKTTNHHVACSLLLGLCLGCGSAAGPAGPGAVADTVENEPSTGAPSGARPAAAIELSPETTSVTEPLRDDGSVDYAAAINRQASDGVTTDSNAAVLFCRAFGPADIADEHRGPYFAALGIDPLPESGNYLVSLAEFTDQHQPQTRDAALQQQSRAMEGPWSRQQYPLVAEWLAAVDEPLNVLVQGTLRPEFYSPLIVPNGRPLDWAAFPLAIEARAATRALLARAMLHLQSGDVRSTGRDILACHRLSRLIGQGPSLVHALVAAAIENKASQSDTVLANSPLLTEPLAAAYLGNLRSLAPLPTLADRVDAMERFTFLDVVQHIARDGLAEIELPKASRSYLESLVAKPVAWNDVLRRGNAWYDRLVVALQAPTYADRQDAVAKLTADLSQQADRYWDRSFLRDGPPAADTPQQRAEILGSVLLGVYSPAASAGDATVTAADNQLRLAQLAVASAAYQREHNAFPQQLAQLSPTYFKQLPVDAFTKGPFEYRPTESACLIYSVGANGVDDAGRDRTATPPGDDHIVRVHASTP